MTYSHSAAVQQEPKHLSDVTYLSPLSQHVVRLPQQKTGLSPVQKLGYGLLTIAFAFGLAQALRCGIASGIKLERLAAQLSMLEQVHQQAQVEQARLQDKISLYSSPIGIEEMARERLGMVADDEVLVRLYPVSVAQR